MTTVAALALVLAIEPAFADKHAKDGPGEGEADKPWAEGVSKKKQKKAFELFEAGNALFAEGKYTEAIEQYEQAIKRWDHPSIEFNLAISLINIRQPLAAWDHLERALAYGAEPLAEHYEEALRYKTLLEASLARLEVKSIDEQAEVSLDGVVLFTGAHKKKLHLLAGKHQLVATRAGYQTETKALDLPAGEITKEEVELHPEKVKVKKIYERTNYERKWAWWVPWVAAGSAVAITLAGTGVYLEARGEMNTYDKQLAQACPTGCKPSTIPSALTQEATRATSLSGVGVTLWTLGGAAGVAAGIMAVLNRPHAVEVRRNREVTFVARPGYVGAALAFKFE